MTQSVPAASFVTISTALAAGFIIPAAAAVFFKKKYGCKTMPFFIGCATFAVFALILEGILHAVILGGGRAQALMAKPLLYGLYGGFMAGLFEETGRFAAFTTILKKYRGDDTTALAYGAGHGGFEAFFVLVTAMATNLVYAVMLNNGETALLTNNMSGEQLAAMEQTFSALCTANPFVFLASIIERLIAVAFHISASVLVWFAAKNKRRFYLYPAAIALHMIFDTIAATLSQMKVHAAVIETACALFLVPCILAAVFIWKKETAAQHGVPAQNDAIIDA